MHIQHQARASHPVCIQPYVDVTAASRQENASLAVKSATCLVCATSSGRPRHSGQVPGSYGQLWGAAWLQPWKKTNCEGRAQWGCTRFGQGSRQVCPAGLQGNMH